MNRKPMLTVLAAAALLATTAGASNVIYVTGFEAGEGFTAGTYNATPSAPVTIGDWILNDGTAVVESGAAVGGSGSQIVTLSGGAQFDRAFTGAEVPAELPNGIFVEGYFRGAGSSLELKDANYPESQPASAILHFSADKGIQAFDGSKAGDERFTTLNITLNDTTWRKVTMHLAFGPTAQDQKWSVWVDNTLAAADLGFRDSVTSFNGFRNLSEFPSGFDAFRVVVPVKGDANGDAALDSADVIRVLEHSLNPISDPILAFNADIDGGGIGTSDWQAIANTVIGQ